MGASETPSKKQVICERCKKAFPSKNALFRHLKASIGSNDSCLKPEEVDEFLRMVVNREENFEKIAILYGYIPSDYYLQQDLKVDSTSNQEWGLKDGDHAAQLLLEAAQEVSLGTANVETQTLKANRSYGCDSRCDEIKEYLCQDENTGALSEVLCMRLPPLFCEEGESKEEKKANENRAVQKWVSDVNTKLSAKIQSLVGDKTENFHAGKMQVFGRLTVSKKFNAEMDVTHRRIDYLLPADFLYSPQMQKADHSLEDFCNMLICFNRGQTTVQSNESGLLTYLHKLKRLMQSFCTQFVEIDQKEMKKSTSNNTSKKRQKSEQKSNVNSTDSTQRDDVNKKNKKKDTKKNEESCGDNSTKKKAVDTKVIKKVKRRRYHNFTPRMMAHEFLAYRRLDRFYHRATVRANEFNSEDLDINIKSVGSRPFIVLSLKGDLFLKGQSRALFGLFVAIILGYIDEEIVECIFDEDYTNLVPAPVLPSFAQFAAEAWYISWEGKMKYILCPRRCNDYEGWNTPDILSQINDFQEEMHCAIIRGWTSCNTNGSIDANKQLKRCSNWLNDNLEAWSKKANEELSMYRKWKEARKAVKESNSKSLTIAASLLPPLESISSSIPKLYEKVLYHLQDINASNLWPTTTPKRQLVMVSIGEGKDQYESLVESHIKAQSKKEVERDSAYSFREGEGGASGSFSVGAMPGAQCEVPKGNKLFPELMKAAFELEIALCPDREPSSTIAINRNAQFRPHVDNGAGAGQSRSLIVGLGTYVGGELMVEGNKHSIRYRPLEFNGWTERHWTLPFIGERYSLVWFTPKGCEGIRGIDLCK